MSNYIYHGYFCPHCHTLIKENQWDICALDGEMMQHATCEMCRTYIAVPNLIWNLPRVDEDKLLEQLADQEHKQWVAWAYAIMKSEKISPERSERWNILFHRQYSDLTEEQKEQDRMWARDVIKILIKAGVHV